MREIELKYGRGMIPFAYDESNFDILDRSASCAGLSDIEIGKKLDAPIDSPRIEEIVNPGESVLIVVPDATRRTGCGQIVNLIVRRLIANGSAPFDIRIIFATGIHRQVTTSEKSAILTPFIHQRIKTLDHHPRDLMQIVRLGETPGGIPVELNRALIEHDHILIVGGISFHYFAGFTGGRKLICPGLASSKTVSETHKLAFDCKTRSRRDGVDTGRLDGNAVHEAFVEAASKVNVSFAVNTIVNDDGDVVDLFCGNWLTSHSAACQSYAAANTIHIQEKRDLVIAGCGGFPHDINMIQAHKALDTAARACTDGGSVILLAECADGLGRDDFLNWFEAENSDALAARLCQKYQVNGQTAWSLLNKAERVEIKIVTALDVSAVEKMRLERIESAAIGENRTGRKGYILPAGNKIALVN